MKVVINKCYGGYGLSVKAQLRYLELQGKKGYVYKISYKNDKATYSKITSIDKIDTKSSNYYVVEKDYGYTTDTIFESYKNVYPETRNDPLLVQVVEELGDKANGWAAELRIVEIPDGIDWELEDYDGIESIHELHRSW